MKVKWAKVCPEMDILNRLERYISREEKEARKHAVMEEDYGYSLCTNTLYYQLNKVRDSLIKQWKKEGILQ